MRAHQLVCTAALLSLTQAQTFALQQSYSGLDFFDRGFTLYEGWDPTFGYVDYVDIGTAKTFGLLDLDEVAATGVARWGVDSKSVLDPTANLGRRSLRLQSQATFLHGLFVLDVAHMPSGLCGVWPAFWMVGTGAWPQTGEIDVIEMTNSLPNNVMSLHTSATPNCTIAGSGMTGTLLTNDCAFANSYTGCAIQSTQANMAGPAFNANGGGVFAMLWTSDGIQIWAFPRNAIPPTISKTGVPDVRQFGMPSASFQGSCNFDAHFPAQQLIFNTDFCGSNAGNTFRKDGCPMATSESWASCNIYVAANPQIFAEAYWEVNYLNVYSVAA